MAHTILLGNETAPGVHPAWVSVTGTDQTAGVVLVGFFYVNGRTQIDSWQHGIAPGDGLEPQDLQELADSEQATVVASEFYSLDGVLVPGSDFGSHAIAVSGYARSVAMSGIDGDYRISILAPNDLAVRNDIREVQAQADHYFKGMPEHEVSIIWRKVYKTARQVVGTGVVVTVAIYFINEESQRRACQASVQSMSIACQQTCNDSSCPEPCRQCCARVSLYERRVCNDTPAYRPVGELYDLCPVDCE